MIFYGGILAVATILMGISFFFGHDTDFDHSPDSIDGEAPGFFNLRVMSMAMAAFGAVGILAEWYGLQYPLLIAIVAGVIFAFIGRWVIRLIWQQQGNSVISGNFTGLLAEVNVDIPANGIGEVYVVTKNGRPSYEMAQSSDGQAIPAGTEVRIINSGKTLTVEKKTKN